MIRRKRDRRKRWKPETRSSRIKMTSMMDILTVLLLFLLKSFVVDTELLAPPPNVQLPHSTSEEPPQSSLIVAISDDVILVGGEPVVSIREAMTGEDLLIEPLEERLDVALGQIEDLSRRKGRIETGPRLITIQGDRSIEFQLLRRVMYTCNFSGFDQLSLAVIRES